MNRYKSDYSNQWHILNVSLSKHFYIKKDNHLKYQSKPLNVTTKNFKKQEKPSIVHYFIFDHFSKLSYGEVHSSLNLIPIEEFLYNAWRDKTNYYFMGKPDNLMVSKRVVELFPKMNNFYKQAIDMGFAEPSSGFQAGSSMIAEWEKKVSIYSKLAHGSVDIDYLTKNPIEVNLFLENDKLRSRYDYWRENIRNYKSISDKDEFMELFS